MPVRGLRPRAARPATGLAGLRVATYAIHVSNLDPSRWSTGVLMIDTHWVFSI